MQGWGGLLVGAFAVIEASQIRTTMALQRQYDCRANDGF
jgi:hypothetical protein